MTALNGELANSNGNSKTLLQPAFAGDASDHVVPAVRFSDFRLIREVGRGGMGIVYEAIQESLQRTVALKVLKLDGQIDKRQSQRFQNEATAAAQLQHENIVPVYSVGVEDGVHYYAMQLIHGRDLAKIIRSARDIVDSRCVRPSGETPPYMGKTAIAPNAVKDSADQTPSADTASFDFVDKDSRPYFRILERLTTRSVNVAPPRDFEDIVRLGVQAANALQHAHESGIVHRDIKPSNLLLDDHGKLWVVDFGLAQMQGAAAMTMTGDVVGTLRYMSPEQPLGNRVLLDQRTDIYSLGITLYELLTLTKAFAGDTPKEIIKQVCFDDPVPLRRLNPMVPQDLETIIQKAISKNPGDRYQTAVEFADDLQRFLRDQPILARRPALRQRFGRWIRRHLLLTTSLAIAIVTLLIASVTSSAVIFNSLTAETNQRKRAESLLNKSEGLRLALAAQQQMESNPGLAMRLAVRSCELTPGVESGTALLQAMSKNHEQRILTPREQITDRFDISPDGQHLVSTSSGRRRGEELSPAIVSDIDTGETVFTLESDAPATSAAYSPDGSFILTTMTNSKRTSAGSPDAAASQSAPELWNSMTGVRKLRFKDAFAGVASTMSFSPASDLVALFGADNSVRLCSTVDGHVAVPLLGHTDRLLSAVFSLDGKRVVSVSLDKTVRVWDAGTGAEIRIFKRDAADPASLSAEFIGDSETVIISSDKGTSLMSVATGEQLNQLHWRETQAIISRDGQFIALKYPFGDMITIRTRQSGQIVTRIQTDQAFSSAKFSPDGNLLIAASANSARIYRVSNGTLKATLNGHTELVQTSAFTANGSRVATASDDGTVRIWNVKSDEEQRTFAPVPTDEFSHPFSISTDSKLLAVATQPVFYCQRINVDGKIIAGEFSGRASRFRCNTERLATVIENTVHVWQCSTSRRIASTTFEDGIVREAVAVPDSPYVVVLIEGGPTYLWNTQDNQRRIIDSPTATALACEAHPTAKRFALSLEDGRCLIVNAESGEILQTLKHDGQVLSAAFNGDGTQLVTVDDTNAVHVWRGAEFTRALSIQSPERRMSRAVFSGDDSAVLTWHTLRKETICAWDAQTGMMLAETDAKENSQVVVHETRPLAVISAASSVVLWDWKIAMQTSLAAETAQYSVLLGDRLLTVEQLNQNDAGSDLSDGETSKLAHWGLTVRDILTQQVVSTTPLTSEPWILSADAGASTAVLSYKIHEVSLVDIATHESLASAGRHASPVFFHGFANDNRSVVCVSKDGTASVWSTAGSLQYSLTAHQHPITTASISPDGRQLATFDESGIGIQWDISNGNQVREFEGHNGPVHSVSFSKSGRQLLTSGSDKTVRRWDLVGRSVAEFKFDQDVRHAELTDDERNVIVIEGDYSSEYGPFAAPPKASRSYRIVKVQVENGEKRLLVNDDSPLLTAKISPDGKLLAVLTQNGIVQLLNVETGTPVKDFNPNRRRVENLAFSPDSGQLVVMYGDEISLWDMTSLSERLRIENTGHLASDPDSLSAEPEWKPFTPDGQWIFSSTDRIKKWPQDPLKASNQQTLRPFNANEIREFSIDILSQE